MIWIALFGEEGGCVMISYGKLIAMREDMQEYTPLRRDEIDERTETRWISTDRKQENEESTYDLECIVLCLG